MNLRESRWLLLSIYIPALLFTFAQGLLIPIMPIYAAGFGGSYTLAGIVVAASWIGTMIADLPVGILLPRIGFRRTMMLGGGLYGSAIIAISFATFSQELIIYQLIAGTGVAFWNISRHAFITHTVPAAARGKVLASFGGLNRVGHFIGPAVGGFIATFYSIEIAIMVAGLVALMIILIALFAINEPVSDEERQGRKKEYAFDVLREVVTDNPRALIAGGLAQVFAQMIRAGRQIVLPLYGAFAIGLSEAQVGQIVSLSSMVDMLLFIPAGIIMDRWGRKAAAIPSFLIMGGAMALIPLTSSYIALLVVGLLIGLGNGIGAGTMMTLGSDLAPPGRTGEFLGMWRLIGDSGHAVAPLIIGSAADSIGLAVTAGSVGGIGLLSASMFIFFVKETRWSSKSDQTVGTREEATKPSGGP